jgi:hypothetical protein
MNDLTIGVDQTEQTILTREISDEALEAAASSWDAIKWPHTNVLLPPILVPRSLKITGEY